MAPYTPVILGDSFTQTASVPIVGGQIVQVSGDNTVAPYDGTGLAWIGVAGFDVQAGDLVTVYAAGTHEVTVAVAAVTAGEAVVAVAGGVAGFAAGSPPDAVSFFGIALTSAPIGGTVRVHQR